MKWDLRHFTRRLPGAITPVLAFLPALPLTAQTNDAANTQSLKRELEELRERTRQLEGKLGEREASRATHPPTAILATTPARPISSICRPEAPLCAPWGCSWCPSRRSAFSIRGLLRPAMRGAFAP